MGNHRDTSKQPTTDLTNNDPRHRVSLEGISVEWFLKTGQLDYYGSNAALFWTKSTLSAFIEPILEEIGVDLFRLIVAHSTSQTLHRYYKKVVETNQITEDFHSRFEKWCDVVAGAGWGRFSLVEFVPEENHAIVKVENPWEISTQQHLAPNDRWGCPFLLGRVIGLFKNAFATNCWAKDDCYYDKNYVIFTIYPSSKTIDSELKRLREEHMTEHEAALEKEIEKKTLELKKSNNILENIANLDFLTNLNNRRAFEKKLLSAIDDKTWNRHSLMFIDLDQFKVINDTCGHHAGDKLLTLVSESLVICTESKYFISRYGGDEFTILMDEENTDICIETANHIRNAISSIKFEWGDKVYQINCSIGLVRLETLKEEVDTAIIAADNACYQAKKNGRNQIYISEQDNELMETRLAEMNWIYRLKQALQKNRLELFFQVIKPLHDRKNFALESLIRMKDDNGNIIMPNEFLPAAENYDLIFDIDCWVIKTVFSKVASLSADYDQIEYIAINLSGKTLSNPKLEDYIEQCFIDYPIDPSRICFEVTETHMMINLETAKSLLLKLRKHGCSVALDDFGAGMSSFGYLRDLPVDKIKIDGSFVKNMHESTVDFTFVESITKVAHAMGIKTVAEFVENEQIVALLTDISVDYLQGYHVGKPVPWQTLFSQN